MENFETCLAGSPTEKFMLRYRDRFMGADLYNILDAYWSFTKGNLGDIDLLIPLRTNQDYISQYCLENLTDELLSLRGKMRRVCGVYKLFDKDQELIYIGRSYTLWSRVLSSARKHNAEYLNYVLTENRQETDIVEASLIKFHKPRNNRGIPSAKAKYGEDNFSWSPRIKIFKKVINPL